MPAYTTVEYEVQPNSLTDPPSYYPRVVPRGIMDKQALANLVNEKLPDVPAEIVISVFDAFREVTMEQLASGNTCTIERFISLKNKLSGKMDTATSPLPEDGYQIIATISDPYQQQIRTVANFSRIGVAAKLPSIAATSDTTTGVADLIVENAGFQLDGSNMKYTPGNADEGIFITSSNATIRQTNIVRNKDSLQYIVPALDPGISSPNVEYLLDCRTRYTENGQLKTGTFGRKIRTKNIISDATTDQVFAVGAAAGPATLDYTGSQVDALILISLDAQGVLQARVGDMDQNFGTKVPVTENASYVLTGLASDVTLNVTDYDTLLANVTSYARYMQEAVDLSPLTP